LYSTLSELENQTKAATAKKPISSFKALTTDATVGGPALAVGVSLQAWGKHLAPDDFIQDQDRSATVSRTVNDAYKSLVEPLGVVVSDSNDAASASKKRKKEELEKAKQAAAGARAPRSRA
jgi:hypothetical protein